MTTSNRFSRRDTYVGGYRYTVVFSNSFARLHDRKVRLLTKRNITILLERFRSADISIFASFITKHVVERKRCSYRSTTTGACCDARGTKAEGYCPFCYRGFAISCKDIKAASDSPCFWLRDTTWY